MPLKITITIKDPPHKHEFPCVYEFLDPFSLKGDDCFVLFFGPQEGVVIYSGAKSPHSINKCSCGWWACTDPKCWKPRPDIKVSFE